ncbi:methyl-accepting chemotaxis protein [Paenibacillus sedimenti]|uniref:Methyl-accepting chemotaxis protein n=1 Tax=Paenibacillus sedimenti TaxID=2770274 RepID=A0A926KJ39_9BACL|nr:methyl-accepting chemotaxis protein [Paenibacillus sedimenti]MBD0378540.1 methyl-accepting chemotaxis protein [Paenibacillus sedimenti]
MDNLIKKVQRPLFKLVNSGLLGRMRIRKKLFISLFSLCLIPLTTVGYLSYSQSSEAIQSQISTYSVQVMDQASSNMAIQLDHLNSYATEIAFSDDVQTILGKRSKGDRAYLGSEYDARLLELINAKYSNLTDFVTDAELLGPDKQMIKPEGSQLWEEKEVAGLVSSASEKKGNTTWSAGHLGSQGVFNDPNLVLSKAVMTKGDSKQIGTILVAVKEAYFRSWLSKIDLGKGSDIFIVNAEGNILSGNKDTLKFNERYPGTLIEEVGKQKTQAFQWERDDGKRYLAAFSQVKGTDWLMITTIPYSYLNEAANRLSLLIIILITVCGLLAFAISLAITKNITVPINRLIASMLLAKEGDLTAEVKIRNHDELGDMAQMYNGMLKSIRQLVFRVAEHTGEVAVHARNLANGSRVLHESSAQNSTAIMHIAEGTSGQAEEASLSVVRMQDLSDCINRVVTDMELISAQVDDTRTKSLESSAVMALLNEKGIETIQMSEVIIENVKSLNTEIHQIEKVTKLIASISGQTHILALNASIEAARAGAAGKSFAVVANEVKALADQTQNLSKLIVEAIQTIQGAARITLSSTDASREKIHEQMNAIQKTDLVLQGVLQSLDEISKLKSNTVRAAESMLVMRDETFSSIAKISAISQEAAAFVEQVGAGSDEQKASAEEFSRLSNGLHGMAQELSKEISVFKV